MRILSFILAFLLDIIPQGDAFLTQLQPRDSILVADQLEYGVVLDAAHGVNLSEPLGLALPDFEKASNDTLVVVRGWQIDSIMAKGRANKGKVEALKASIVLAPFEEGRYVLPEIPVQITTQAGSDTLLFKGLEMDVKSMPVDTATFKPNDIKGQITYPVTLAEIAEYSGIALGALALVAVLVLLVVKLTRRRGRDVEVHKDPAHIVALRELDRYRSEKFWAPEKQKQFYSGITDALKTYIDDRFGVDAPEMTTAELFDALQKEEGITPELFEELKKLFETADFVKFAKAFADDEENSKALPLAVRFVTTTYQQEIEKDVL